jgi:hypothetical protein
MTRPNAITLNGQYVSTHLTPHEQDIYECGELAGRAKALSALRGQVNVLPGFSERAHYWIRRDEVIQLIGESGNG